jgi:GT2 family glycosyltransferase
MQRPDAALVIVTYRTPELTTECLSLARDAADDLTLEAVVVDNASGGHSVPYLRQRRR